jgi:hypothetical protein
MLNWKYSIGDQVFYYSRHCSTIVLDLLKKQSVSIKPFNIIFFYNQLIRFCQYSNCLNLKTKLNVNLIFAKSPEKLFFNRSTVVASIE